MLGLTSSSIYLEDTHAQEIVVIVKEFKNGKASNIPIVVVKKTAHLISPILAKLYNQCMLDGTFPSEFKTARVTPIFKKIVQANPTQNFELSTVALVKGFSTFLNS